MHEMSDGTRHDARILVVDSNEQRALWMKRMLERGRYDRVTTASSRHEAVLPCQQHWPDLVLLDVEKPGLEATVGTSTLAELERVSGAPFLLLVDEGDRLTRLATLERDARDFVRKPVDELEMLSRVRRLLELRLLQQTLNDQHRLLQDSERRRSRELRDARMEAIRKLALTAETRDGNTGLHVARIAEYAVVLGRRLGLSEQQVGAIAQAALLHDIGKVAIPDVILQKPGRLDDREWEVMQTHTTVGSQLLAGSESAEMQMAERVALTHHEHWDGTGYPGGLQGNEIPLEGRICAISDVFDALTSERPYKSAWNPEDAVREVIREQGHQFDPEVVEAFRTSLDSIMSIRSNLAH